MRRIPGRGLRASFRRLARADRDSAFLASELAASRSAARAFAVMAATGTLLIAVVHSAIDPAYRPPISLGPIAIGLVLGLWMALVRVPGATVRPVLFILASLTVLAVVIDQGFGPSEGLLSFRLGALVPVAVTAFARWPTWWHVRWLMAMLAGLGLVVIARIGSAEAEVRIRSSFIVGALVSVAGYVLLRLERYRAAILPRRLDAARLRTQSTNEALRRSLDLVRGSRLTIRKLGGILPTCASCARVRSDDDSEWLPLSEYLVRRGDVALSHGLCPDCLAAAMARAEDARD